MTAGFLYIYGNELGVVLRGSYLWASCTGIGVLDCMSTVSL